jgi:hypothetical protein
MRHLLTAAAVIAVGGFFALTPARAEMLYYQGGPVVQNGMCQISTDGDQRYGYWAPCPNQPVQMHHRSKRVKS